MCISQCGQAGHVFGPYRLLNLEWRMELTMALVQLAVLVAAFKRLLNQPWVRIMVADTAILPI